MEGRRPRLLQPKGAGGQRSLRAFFRTGRGNVDRGPWAQALPLRDTVELAGILVHVVHDLQDLDLDPAAAGIRVVVTGHSHVPKKMLQGGVLYVNPGSCGPRRFDLPVTVALLRVSGDAVDATIVPLVQSAGR